MIELCRCCKEAKFLCTQFQLQLLEVYLGEVLLLRLLPYSIIEVEEKAEVIMEKVDKGMNIFFWLSGVFK